MLPATRPGKLRRPRLKRWSGTTAAACATVQGMRRACREKLARPGRECGFILAPAIPGGSGVVAEAPSTTKRLVSCPSCGAPLRFRGATSVVAVCTYCKATLVREGANLENIGKQAELLEDDTPIQIGTEGKHRGVGFTV